MPDAKFLKHSGYWDLKTNSPGYLNLAIEENDIAEWTRIQRDEEVPIYIIHGNVEDDRAWLADTLDGVLSRQLSHNNQPRSGSGSLDSWRLFARGGIAFRDFFPWIA